MIEITAEIRAFIDKAAAGVELAEDEYIDLSDGLIHCKKCGGQRQTVVPCFGKSGYFMPRCICQCQREPEEQRKAAEERQRRMERIKRRKAQGLQDRYLYDYTFSNDNGQNPLMDKAHAYVETWKEAYKSNIGLLLFGDVGTGKSFFAGCIANALLDQDVPVLMTNFPTILNRLTGMFSEDRADFIASFDAVSYTHLAPPFPTKTAPLGFRGAPCLDCCVLRPRWGTTLPKPLVRHRSRNIRKRLSRPLRPEYPSPKGGDPHRFLPYPRQYHQAQRGPFRCCRSRLPQRNQADE